MVSREILIRIRAPLLLLGLVTLLGAIWAGWIRAGWQWPVLQPGLVLAHGPLMVAGFLGTLISLERAVALNRPWMYFGPLLSGVGALLILLGVQPGWGPWLITFSSAVLVLIFAVIVRQHAALYTVVMAAGSLAWLAGNLGWLAGLPIYRLVLWWVAFLMMTIAGERLELSRVLRLSSFVNRTFLLICGLYLLGLVVLALDANWGSRSVGAGHLGLAVWLLRFDIARKTVRQTGLTRFIALCLLLGYLWMAVGGLIGLWYGALAAGPIYDALLHSLLVGFVFSMIFGHAPIIFPSVLRLPINYHPAFYIHLALLHVSLLLRVGGDLSGSFPLVRWGALLNGVAVLLFLVVTAATIVRSRFRERAGA